MGLVQAYAVYDSLEIPLTSQAAPADFKSKQMQDAKQPFDRLATNWPWMTFGRE